VNDKDGFVANVWRALQFSPDETARWCDWPVNHADLMARKKAMLENETRLLENLAADPEWHDPKMAGYWIWAASCWIGSGLTRPGSVPHLSKGGQGVHRLGPRPHLSDGGMGVQEPYNSRLYDWFRQLSERLRYVRVVCGDWTRVCGGNWQDKRGIVGIFIDPPYGDADRDNAIYHHDSLQIAPAVEEWCLARGGLPSYRIVLAGYDSEYGRLVEAGWLTEQWQANGGYANTKRLATTARGKANRRREMLFFSPHCQRDRLF
jgi:hypothetical protein